MEHYELMKEWVHSVEVSSVSTREQLRLVRDRSELPFSDAVSELIDGFDFDAEEAKLESWFRTLIKREPPLGKRGGITELFRRQPLAALWFGLFDTSDCPVDDRIYPALYVAGADIVNPDDEDCDWAVRPAWWPDGRYADSAFLKSLVDADSEAQELISRVYVACVACRLCRSKVSELCQYSEWLAIGTGHDGGGGDVIAWIDEDGVHPRNWRPSSID